MRLVIGLKNSALLKKKSLIYSDGDPVKQQEFIDLIKEIDEKDIVYIDEVGFEASEGERTHAYAPRGERAPGHISGKRSPRQNVIAGLCDKEIVAPLIYEDTMNAASYERYMIQYLLPNLRAGQFIIQDNARFHKISDAIKTELEVRGCRIIYLPPYSPQLNPIEHLWAWMKKKLKRASDCVETLRTKLGQILANRYFKADKNVRF